MRAFAVVVTLLLAGMAQAQSVPVRGGEHDGFTRLVLRVPDGAAWRLAPVPGGFQLGLPDSVVYDLRRAFDRIPRRRVQALLPLGKGQLGLSISCDCHAEATLFRGVGLVIDVFDGPGPSRGLSPGLVTPVPPGSGLPLLLGPLPGPPAFGPLTEALAEPPPLVEEVDRVAQTEAAILESVAAAASEGLLDVAPARELPDPSDLSPADEPPPVPVGPTTASATPAPPELPAAGAQGTVAAELQPGLAFRTGSDLDSRNQAPLGATGTPCLPKEAFDMAAWAGSGEFDAEISAHLAQVSDERDRIDPEAVEALARAYLSFGFGREAAQALEVDGRSSRGRDELGLLARLVDGEPVPPHAFEDQAGCLGPVALWRALARGTLLGTDDRERSAMVIALRLLPQGLRGPIALRVAGLLLDSGDALGADEVAALAEDNSTEALLTQAEITRDTEGPAPALAQLESIAESDARMTPDGLVELIDLSIAEGEVVPEPTLELARALRFEQGGEAARALLLAEVRALTAAARFEEALTLLREEEAAHPGEDLDAARTATVLALTEKLGDAAFLELALGDLPANLSSEARATVAQRLDDLGFPDEAWTLRRAGAKDAEPAPILSAKLAPVLDSPRPEAGFGDAPVLASAELDSPGPGPSDAWQEPPPALDPAPADAAAAEPRPAIPTALPAPVPLPQGAPGGAADPVPADVTTTAPEAPDLSQTLTTLAARRELLDRADEARAQAAALLERAPIE